MQASSAYQTTASVDTDTFHPRDDAPVDQAEEAEPSRVLPLPAPDDASASAPGGRPQLGLGERVQMDHLGPLVIGADGSVGRIANWEKLTEREREVALRRITARNRERLARLRGEPGQEEGVQAAEAQGEAAQAQQQRQQQQGQGEAGEGSQPAEVM